jgi:hypothetical protein
VAKGRKTGGRVAGTPNALSSQVKLNFLRAFEGLGGATKLQEWAQENLTEFYKLYARLLPTESSVTQETTIRVADSAALRERLNRALEGRSQPTIQ